LLGHRHRSVQQPRALCRPFVHARPDYWSDWRVRGSQRCGVGSWARADGERPRAVVVHPKFPADRDDLVAWEAAEAMALAKAVRWRIVGDMESEEASSGLSSGSEEEDEDDDEGDKAEAIARCAKDRSVCFSDDHVAQMDRPDPRFFFHVAELSRIAVRVAQTRSDVLFVNAALSPAQQRNLEAAMDLAARAQRHTRGRHVRSCGAIGWRQHRDLGMDKECDETGPGIAIFDRPRVLLAIFARRATSVIARLRIELAEAQQMKARLGAAAVQGVSGQLLRVADALARGMPRRDRNALLPRSGTARGVSTSFNSSPQNTRQKQQRAVEEKERRIRDELVRVQASRGKLRQNRKGLWSIGLVGYTNVGKSAIVNRLTGSSLLVRDGVFVTLDVAARIVQLPSGAECYVLDSVGFVKDLPPELMDAFAATVEELQAADVVLHVRDISHPLRDEHGAVVVGVLERAGIDIQRRVVEVWNKSDLVSGREFRHFRYIRCKQDSATPLCLISALRGEGFEALLEEVDNKLQQLDVRRVPGRACARGALEAPRLRSLQRVRVLDGLPPDLAAEQWAFLHEHCKVVEDSITANGGATILEAWMDDAARSRCLKKFGTAMLL